MSNTIAQTAGSLVFKYPVNGVVDAVTGAELDLGNSITLDILASAVTESNSSTMGTSKVTAAFGILELTFTGTGSESGTIYIHPTFATNPSSYFAINQVYLVEGSPITASSGVYNLGTVTTTKKAYVKVSYVGDLYVTSTATLDLEPYEGAGDVIRGASTVTIANQFANLTSVVTPYRNSNTAITSGETVVPYETFYYYTVVTNEGNANSTETSFDQSIDHVNLNYVRIEKSATGEVAVPGNWTDVSAVASYNTSTGVLTYTADNSIAVSAHYYFRIYVTVK